MGVRTCKGKEGAVVWVMVRVCGAVIHVLGWDAVSVLGPDLGMEV